MRALNLVVKMSSLAPISQVLQTYSTIPNIKHKRRPKMKRKWTFLSLCMITLKKEQLLDRASTKIYGQRRKSKFPLHTGWTWPSDDLCFIWRFLLLFFLSVYSLAFFFFLRTFMDFCGLMRTDGSTQYIEPLTLLASEIVSPSLLQADNSGTS